MDELAVYLKEVFCIELLSAILSNPRDREKAWKVRIRPVLKKEELVFQFEVFIGKRQFKGPANGWNSSGRCRLTRRVSGPQCWSAKREK